MLNTVVTCIFQISYATPIIRLLIRVISDLNFNCCYFLDLNKHTMQLKDGDYSGGNHFSKFSSHSYNYAIN